MAEQDSWMHVLTEHIENPESFEPAVVDRIWRVRKRNCTEMYVF